MKSYVVKEREDGSRFFDENTPTGQVSEDTIGAGLKIDATGKVVVDPPAIDGVVHTTGNEVVGGFKVLDNSPLYIRHNRLEDKGNTLTATSISEVYFVAKNAPAGAAYGPSGLAVVGSHVEASGKSFATLTASKNATEDVRTNIEVGFTASGDAYTRAPTPPLADNSTQIATTAWVKNVLPSANGFKVNPDGTVSVDFSQMDEATINAIRKEMGVKIPLTANKSFYVNGTTGSDTLDEGRGLTAAKPFKTIQACVNYVTRDYDISAYIAYIEVANGQYAERTLVPDFNRTTGSIFIRGASKTGCVITTTHKDNYCIQARGPVSVGRMTLIRNNQTETIAPNTASNILVANTNSGSLAITDVDIIFNAYVTQTNSNCFIQAGAGSVVNINDGVSLKTVLYDGAAVGGITAIDAARDAYLSINRDITIEGPFARVARCLGGYIQRNVNTAPVFIDTNVTGRRYEVGNNGGMYIQLGAQSKTWFPGTIDGTVDAETYSWYK